MNNHPNLCTKDDLSFAINPNPWILVLEQKSISVALNDMIPKNQNYHCNENVKEPKKIPKEAQGIV